MTLSKKQLEKLNNIQNMINTNLARIDVRSQHYFKPDKTVFRKMEKYLKVWAQNACDRTALDSAAELHTVLYNLTRIVTSTWDLSTIVLTLTQYDMECCQVVLMNGIVNNATDKRRAIAWRFKEGQLLPSANSFWVMMQ